MSRVRPLLLSLVGMMCVGLSIAPSIANAEPSLLCPGLGTNPELFALCVEIAGELLLVGLPMEETPEFLLEKKAGTKTKLEVANGLTIECTTVSAEKSKFDAPPAESVLVLAKLVFLGCKALPANLEAKCEIVEGEGTEKEHIVTKEVDGMWLPSEDGHIEFKPVAGNLYAVITVKSKAGQTCPVAVTNGKVEGDEENFILCTTPEPEVDKLDHIVECLLAGSEKILFAEAAAKFELLGEILLDPPFEGKAFEIVLVTEV